MTGAAHGIGRACTQRLARPLTVTVLDLNGDAAKDVTEKIGGEALQADLSDYWVLDSLWVKADVVVNNAGLQRVARIEDFPPERFSVMLRLMLKAPFRIVRAALQGRYEKGWGSVINVSSVHGMRVSPYKAAYVAAKHGLEGFSKVFAGGRSARRNFELRLSGLGQDTAPQDQIADQAKVRGIPEYEVIEKIMVESPPIQRLIEPEEVVELVVFLCAPGTSVISDVRLTMDGGWNTR